jgi:hypothetical protein
VCVITQFILYEYTQKLERNEGWREELPRGPRDFLREAFDVCCLRRARDMER